MPRYGAKTYGGKSNRKADKNSQFDELWAKSQGSKMSAPEFSPIKQSPLRTGKANQSFINIGPTSPTRHYQTRSSPVKPGANSPGAGMRRTRSNSSADDPFSFGLEDDMAKSPTRKSSRLTRNSSAENKVSAVDVDNRSRRTQVVNVKSKSKSSASNLDDIIDPKGKRQPSILKYTTKVSSSKDAGKKETNADEESDSGSATGIFTDGFGSPCVSAVSSLSDDIVLLSSPELPGSANHTTQGLHSYARSPERQPSAAVSPNKQTADKPEENSVAKRKSRDLRTNGNLKSVSETSKMSVNDDFEFDEPRDVIEGSQTDSTKNLRTKTKVDSAFKMQGSDDKDEFDFDDGLSDNSGSKQGSPVITEAGKSKDETGIIKKRSKELAGITRRIFNSPKKVRRQCN